MCGRYRVTTELGEVIDHFHDLAIHRPFTPRFNLAPTQEAPVIHLPEGKATVEMMRWGLVPSWAKDTKDAGRAINARSETAADKPTFRAAFRHRRCLVPVHGYYEWTTTPKGKQPWHFQRKSGKIMCFAGLWESWTLPGSPDRPKPAEALHTFTILTTEPTEFAARYHNRMPVILPERVWDAWLNPDAGREAMEQLLTPYTTEELEAWPVTPRMNTPRFESPECVTPVAEDDNELEPD